MRAAPRDVEPYCTGARHTQVPGQGIRERKKERKKERASGHIREDDTELNFLGVATDSGVVSTAGQLRKQLNKIVSFCSCGWHLPWQTCVHS